MMTTGYVIWEIDLTGVVPCEYCGVAAADECVTKAGKEASRAHDCRIMLWDDEAQKFVTR